MPVMAIRIDPLGASSTIIRRMLQTPAPLRIALDAHVVGRRQTGNETYVVNLGSALAQRTDVVTLAYVDRGVRWPEGLASPRLRELRFRTRQLRIPIELPYRARVDGADIVHVQYVAPLTRMPIVTAIHDLSFEDVPGLFSRPTTWRLKISVRLSARRSAAVVTLSEFSRSRLLHHYDLQPERVIVAPAGVSDRWKRLSPPAVASRLAGLQLPGRFILAVGNLHPRKNIPRLIHAVAALRKGGADVALVLAGQPGWRAEHVQAAIDDVRGRDWIHLTGYVPDQTLEALYTEALAVAYLSTYEGFGLPVAEALATGAIVVASNTTSIPEVAGDAAILVNPLDDEAIAHGLETALTDGDVRRRLRIAGPRRAAALTWRNCADATVTAYHVALGLDSPPRSNTGQ
jgi:glycosyltransferase involved in cell wall biosynthesis